MNPAHEGADHSASREVQALRADRPWAGDFTRVGDVLPKLLRDLAEGYDDDIASARMGHLADFFESASVELEVGQDDLQAA